jgi:carboxylesterase type B
VQENIATFGGDRDNVTIFGQSSGAMSVATLLAMPRATGLFRRAIAQSGAGHHVLALEMAQRVSQALAKRLNKVSPTREAIAEVPMHRLLQAQRELTDTPPRLVRVRCAQRPFLRRKCAGVMPCDATGVLRLLLSQILPCGSECLHEQ